MAEYGLADEIQALVAAGVPAGQEQEFAAEADRFERDLAAFEVAVDAVSLGALEQPWEREAQQQAAAVRDLRVELGEEGA